MQDHIFERMARERKIPCAGEIPTPDEWLRYVVERLKDDGQEGLLRKYLIW